MNKYASTYLVSLLIISICLFFLLGITLHTKEPMRDLLLTIVVVHLIMDKLGFASYLRNTDSVLEKSKDDKPL